MLKQRIDFYSRVAGDLTLATTNVPEDAATVKLNPLSRSQSVLVYCSSDSALSLNSFYSSCVERFSSKDIEKVEYIEVSVALLLEARGYTGKCCDRTEHFLCGCLRKV